MVDLLLYVLFFALLVLAVLAGLWMMRSSLGGQSPMVALFGPRPDKRLAVVEHASVDGRRKLVLVRRDNVEHLIMTGGPVDVVIETGIDTTRSDAVVVPRFGGADGEERRDPPVFGRQNRNTAARSGQQVAE
ncbi:MAG: flagellar biosynthetic protein FliO [Hyphomicrobiaceae bacterium]